MPANPVYSANDLAEAKEHIEGTGEDEGPHVITERADALLAVLAPELPDENVYLAGRIALTTDEVMLALGIGRKALEAATKRGEIPSVRIGNRRLYPTKAVENHLTALAYAESGALDAWEAALVRGTATRIKATRRRAWERRKRLRNKLAAARRAGVNVEDTLGRDYLTQMRTEVLELQTQQVLTERVAKDMLLELDRAVRVYGMDDRSLAEPRLGLPDDQRVGGVE